MGLFGTAHRSGGGSVTKICHTYPRMIKCGTIIILWYCLKCKKNTKSKNQKVVKTRKGRIMLSSKCIVCDNRKFIKKHEAEGLLSLLVKNSLIGPLLK